MSQTAEQLEAELLAHLRALSPEQQRRVVDFARTLDGEAPRGVTGRALADMDFGFSPEDLREMAAAIEDCEQIGPPAS